MSSRFRWLSKVVMVAAVPALILAIVYMLPPALAASSDHSSRAVPGLAPVALPALAALHSLAAPPAPPAAPAPPEPPEPPSPRSHHVHRYSDDDDDHDEAEQGAWLGVTLSEIDEEGARVASVADDSPADEAGLERGDRIIGIEGKKVISSRDVVRAIRSSEPGDKVSIRILRDGDQRTLTATLTARKTRDRRSYKVVTPDSDDEELEIEIPEMRELEDTPGAPDRHMRLFTQSRTWIGVEVHPMSPELREALKAPSDRGLLINRVVEDSPAEEAGLRAGDIIIEVGDKGIDDVGDIGRALRDNDAGDNVEVKVVRNGSERTLDVKLDERPGARRGRRGFYLPGAIGPEVRLAIEKSIREAMETAHKAMREANEALRMQNDKIRVEQHKVREEIQKQMQELRQQLQTMPPPVIRARTIHDI